MKTNQKGFIVPLVIVIIALLAIGGGAYVYTKNKEATQTSTTTTATTTTEVSNNQTATTTSTGSTPTKTNQNPSTVTSNWKVYANANYGFTISLPSTWTQDSQYSSKDNVIFTSSSVKKGESYELIFRTGDAVSYPDIKGITTIAGVSWNVTGSSDIEGYIIKYSTTHNAIKYDFMVHSDDEAMLKQILSTLKFTSSANTTVSSETKTYINSQYGFSIDYPAGTQVNTTAGNQIENSNISGKIAVLQPNTTKGSLTIEAEPSANCTDTTSGANSSQKTINGISFTVYNLDRILSTNNSVTAREYCTIHAGTEYKLITQLPYIGTPLQVEADAVLNQIVASFKFTK